MSKKKRWIPGIVGFCLILGATGCAGLADMGNTYALDQRIETFASSGSGRTADGFAADLAVVTDGTDGDGTLTAQSAGVFPLDGGNAVFAQDHIDQIFFQFMKFHVILFSSYFIVKGRTTDIASVIRPYRNTGLIFPAFVYLCITLPQIISPGNAQKFSLMPLSSRILPQHHTTDRGSSAAADRSAHIFRI